MRRARLTIPFSVAGAEALPTGAARAIVVSPPIDPSSADGGSGRSARERLAVAYVPDPKAKGLDVVVAGLGGGGAARRATRGLRDRP